MSSSAARVSPPPIAGPAAKALETLTSPQRAFLQGLPKAELHAHLHGSIPLPVLRDLAVEYLEHKNPTVASSAVQAGLDQLQKGVILTEIHDFFGLFPAIYALIATPSALAQVTRSVLAHFLDGDDPQCSYLELRSTPRKADGMTRAVYLQIVLSEVERYAPERAALIVSLDRRMDAATASECVALATDLKKAGRRIVGIDLCGDPMAGNMVDFRKHFEEAKGAGLGVTLHIAETAKNTADDTSQLLACQPDRLGHATFLDEAAKKIVVERKTCIEVCLTSNLLCKTVPILDAHHIRYYLQRDHPIAICTDDVLPFRNSLLGEYALLLAKPPYGLGLDEQEVRRVAAYSMANRFPSLA